MAFQCQLRALVTYHQSPPHVTNPRVPDKLSQMLREISAGGVVLRSGTEGWQVAVIEPQSKPPATSKGSADKKRAQKQVLALPKGLVDSGEKPEQTAIREVMEETGLATSLIAKLGDIKYVYVRSWGDKERVFKIVSFYLFRYESGRIDGIAEDMRIEVKRALWIPLDQALRKLAYGGEKDIIRRAQEYLREHPEFV
jgi:8-oxo-dGTP pyrophosphatase MutT (NUDIX family)